MGPYASERTSLSILTLANGRDGNIRVKGLDEQRRADGRIDLHEVRVVTTTQQPAGDLTQIVQHGLRQLLQYRH